MRAPGFVFLAVVEAYLASLETVSEFHDDPAGAAALTPDPKDDYLIALAVATGTDLLISGDKHLADLADPPVPVLRPRQFLHRLEA